MEKPHLKYNIIINCFRTGHTQRILYDQRRTLSLCESCGVNQPTKFKHILTEWHLPNQQPQINEDKKGNDT